MSAIKQLVIKDGATTPVDHTFVPNRPQQGDTPAQWFEKSTSTPQGYLELRHSIKKMADGSSKIIFSLDLPVLAAIPANCCDATNVPKVAYTSIARLEFRVPAVSTEQNRKDLLAYARNLLANAVSTESVVNLEPTW